MTRPWRCLAPELADPHGADCDAHGDTDSGAAEHTKDTGHPTITIPRKERTGS